jgi:hypothetical protein
VHFEPRRSLIRLEGISEELEASPSLELHGFAAYMAYSDIRLKSEDGNPFEQLEVRLTASDRAGIITWRTSYANSPPHSTVPARRLELSVILRKEL